MIMKKLRSYFEEKFGDLANNLTDEQIEDVVISLIKGKSDGIPSSQLLNENVVSDTNGHSGGGVKFPKFNITEPNNHKVPNYDIEIEGVFFSEKNETSKYNGKTSKHKMYKGTIVEDKIGNSKKGMFIRGTYDDAFDVDGGMIIKNGRTLFVRGMSVNDIPNKTENAKLPRISNVLKPQPEVISGTDRFVVKEDVFENNWKKFFTNADSKGNIERIYPTVKIDRDISRGFVNITINKSHRTDGIDYPSLIFNSVVYNSGKHGIVKF